MKIVALLPMKENSERVKGKNFKCLEGRPLFRWMLDTLLEVSEIDLVVINTDASAILTKNGLVDHEKILVRDRKLEICGDFVSMNKIINDDISNVNADIYLMTHTTNPLLSKSSIELAIEKYKSALKDKKADSLFTVSNVQERFYDKNANPINHDPNKLIRTQDLETWYKENSNLYLFNKESFAASGARIGKKPIMLETEPYESIDIDTQADWDLAEILIQYYQNKGIIK